MSRTVRTIMARLRNLVRAVSISGTDDTDDWLLALFYAGILGFALGAVVGRFI